jgi:hypothetical protein
VSQKGRHLIPIPDAVMLATLAQASRFTTRMARALDYGIQKGGRRAGVPRGAPARLRFLSQIVAGTPHPEPGGQARTSPFTDARGSR